MLATVQSGAYKFVLVLHLAAAIVGFGGVVLNGIYGRLAMRASGPEGLAINERARELVAMGPPGA